MPAIQYGGQRLELLAGETVLDCLLRNGAAISYSCRAGACQSCLVRGSEGTIPEFAQRGLKDTLRAQGYFLACSCQPKTDLTVSAPGSEARAAARISGVEPLTESVLRVRLRTENPLSYFAGQYVSLFREDGLARSYSLASLPEESELELHVRRIAGGAMSGWLGEVKAGTPVWLQGPAGNCFYAAGTGEEPLLLAGTGTGLAPLYGIARDALRQGHRGEIWLFHGALTRAGLYLRGELEEMARRHANFHYVAAVREGTEEDQTGAAETGELDRAILTRFPALAGWRGYVCGDPGLVNSLRKKLFLAGMASKAINADAFLPSAP
jgi:NAD(P)H-flavin reductase/ferredoxin